MSIFRRLLVREVYNPERMHSLLVDEEESISTIIQEFAEEPALRGIFVVDKEKIFKGVITRWDLLNWAKFKLGAMIDRRRIHEASHARNIIENLITYAYSTTAMELVPEDGHNAYVRPEDNVIVALNLMMSLDLIDVPVIDEKGKIIGDLKLTEILNKIIQISTNISK